MADAQQAQLVRLNAPSILGTKETHESLRTWETKVKTYFARDVLFRKFLDAGECAAWNRALANCGFQDDQNGPQANRLTAPQKFAQLTLFIDNLLGFMPNVFLTDSFHAATSLADVFAIVRRSYGVETTTRSLLDFSTLQIQAGESYLAFFDRLVAHSMQHLAPAGVAPVRGIAVMNARTGDAMTISHLNMLTVWWMTKINVSLPAIVQLELSDVLRQPANTLCSLVSRIAESADAWISKQSGAVNFLSADRFDQSDLTDYGDNDGFCC